jgi:hypothetical protein
MLCMAFAATIAPAIPNAAPKPTWLLLAAVELALLMIRSCWYNCWLSVRVRTRE